MAPPLQVNNAGLLRVVWAQGGSAYAVNVYGVIGTQAQPPTQAITDTIAGAMRTSLTSSGLAAVQGTAITLSQISLRTIHTASAGEFVASGAAVAGTAVGNLLPLQVSFCVTIRTVDSGGAPLAGRRFRGRSYIPGFTVASNDANGGVVAATRTAAVAWVAAINTALSGSAYGLAVVSRPVWREDPLGSGNFVLIRAGQVNRQGGVIGRDLIWDTQRRRLIPGI